MGTMNISLPDSLKEFVDEQVEQRGFGTSSEYVRELIRKDQERTQLRGLLLEGAASPQGSVIDADYFEKLRRVAANSKMAASRRMDTVEWLRMQRIACCASESEL